MAVIGKGVADGGISIDKLINQMISQSRFSISISIIIDPKRQHLLISMLSLCDYELPSHHNCLY